MARKIKIEFEKDKKSTFDPKKHVKEYKRKCKQCGKVWHSLEAREKEIERSIKSSGCIGAATACGSPSTSAQSMRSGQARQDTLSKLRSCQKCGSANYTEETIIYEKK